MTTTYRGMDGSLSYGGTAVAATESWEAEARLEIMDATVQGDAWKEQTPGVGEWTAQTTLRLDYADAGQAALIGALITATPSTTPAAFKGIISGSTKYFTGNCFVESAGIPSQTGQIVKAPVTLRGTGAPSISWT
jgi:hypothetical protein